VRQAINKIDMAEKFFIVILRRKKGIEIKKHKGQAKKEIAKRGKIQLKRG
jgi:hypothetical protein